MYPPNYWKKQEGTWFGSKYLLKEFLGCGAFGAVFKADEMLAERVMQSVAVKIVIADINNLDTQLAELQLSVKFRHPHLINGITCEQGEIFGDLCLGLVMELADESLESYCAKQAQGLSVETVHTITQHLAEGLKALHQDGITHRDLKPANVLLVKNKWKLADFGIARSLQDKTSTYTNPSQQIGTTAYMPPEAYSGKISPAWDIWSLGVIVHQLLSGQHPFPTQLAPELMRMVLIEEPQIDPKVTSPLREIVAGCLIKDPQQRWSAEQVLKKLKPSSPVEVGQARQQLVDSQNTQEPSQKNVQEPAQKPAVQFATLSPKIFTTIIEDLGKGISLELIQLPGGKFMMGAPDSDSEAFKNEKLQHRVKVEEFAIGKYPITQEQYQAVMGNNPSKFIGWFHENSKHPVEQVSWNNAKEFCKKLSQATGKQYRLPSEAEWEYACRAWTITRYYFGDNSYQLENYAWFDKNSKNSTQRVGNKKPNLWGLYDMHGNVYEWCEDEWHKNYEGAPEDGSAWVESDNSLRVLRGGSWACGSGYCRSSYRDEGNSHGRVTNHGFRVVLLL